MFTSVSVLKVSTSAVESLGKRVQPTTAQPPQVSNHRKLTFTQICVYQMWLLFSPSSRSITIY